MNRFLSLFSGNIKAVYSCYDRVIIRGYILWMFSAANLISFLGERGFKKHTTGVMRIFTDQLNSHIEKEAQRYGIPILWWPKVDGGKNGNKLAYVEKHYVKKLKKRGNFTYCIIADREAAFTYATREYVNKKGEPYDKMYNCRKFVKHYYIYFQDQLLGGPCYLKLSTYFPFYAEFYFNAHNMLVLSMERKGLAYRKDGNALTMIENGKEVQKIVWSLSGKQVRDRIGYWMRRFFRFDKGKYSTVPKELHHDWFCSQVEICTNIIFKSSEFCTRLFERLLDKFSRIGLPDSLRCIFGKRRTRKDTKSNWFLKNSIKFYNKLGYYLRIETTINNPKSLGLGKPVIHLREYLSYGEKCNRRLMNCFADIDVKSVAENEMEKLNQTVVTESGRQVAAIDLRKKRQVALFSELLKAEYCVHGFRTSQLLENLPEFYSNLVQIRYEIAKLRARGWVEKKKGKSFYRVTEMGYQVLWMKTAWNLHFERPMISMTYQDMAPQSVSAPSELESAYRQLDEGLSLIAKELYLKKAA
jgi:hypothetical protein